MAVVGWWATWPAETVNGAIVSDHTCYHFLFPQGLTGDKNTRGLTYPPELLEKIAPLVRRPATSRRRRRAVLQVTPKSSPARSTSTTTSATSSGRSRRPTATGRSASSCGGGASRPADGLHRGRRIPSSHLFGHLFRAGTLGRAGRAAGELGEAVEAMYLLRRPGAGRLSSRSWAATRRWSCCPTTASAGRAAGRSEQDPRHAAGERALPPAEGILYLYGRGGQARAARRNRPSSTSPRPLLALAGLAPARDMPGRVLTEAFDSRFTGPASRPTRPGSQPHGELAGRGGRPGDPGAAQEPRLPRRLRRWRARAA